MTISSATNKVSYSGNASTTVFAYAFPITADADLKVYIRVTATGAETLKSLSTHYTVSGAGGASGGNVTFTSGNTPASGETVVIIRDVPATQSLDLVENDSFSAESLEDSLDRVTMISSDVKEELSRTIKLSRTNTMTSTEFANSAADRASKVLSFDSSGELSVTQELGTLKGNWAASTAYVLRDLIKDTSNNNIYICVTAHTSSGSQPISSNTDSAKWSLIVDAASATTSATAAATSAQLADDYAVKTSGAVTGSDFSSKAWAVGGTDVTDTASRGPAKEWAINPEDQTVDGTSYSALHHATKGAASATAAASSASPASTAATTATNYATKVDGAVTGTDFSAKSWAIGGTNVTDTASRGAAKEWAIEAEDNTVAGAGTYSALHYSAKASASATAAASSATSAAASSAASSAAGLTYTYSTTTADADPGTGVIRFNNGTLSSATAAYMDDTDANSVDVSTHLLTWDDSSTTSNRGTLKMVKSGTPSTYALYTISGASTDASGYVKHALTHVASNGSFSNSDTVIIHNTRSGDTGSFSSGAVDLNGEKLTLDANGNTSIHASTDDQIDIEISGADDFRFTANNFNVLSGSTLTIDSGATITNSGTANGFGVDAESAYAGVLQTNANFVDQVIFGPSVDGLPWAGLWSKASVFSSLMLATIEDEGSNTEINIWDLTEQSAGAISTTPLATVDLASAATPTSVAACMGYIIVGSEDGTHIIDPHSGSWAERTDGWPRSLSTSTIPALVNNDVQAVAATISDSAPFDPRTGGFIPTFACTYGTGAAEASIIKDNGVVYDHTSFTVSAAGAKAIGFIGQEIYFGCENTGDTIRLSTLPIAAIQADDWATNNTLKKARASDNFLGCDGGSAFSYEQAVFADSDGLSIYRDPVNTSSAQEGLTAMINRTYNTGYFSYDTKGTWLANSKTVDRSGNGNTLTENGTVTEAAVASGAELNGYSGWSTSNYFETPTADADIEMGTSSFHYGFWYKTGGASTNIACYYRHATTGATPQWGSSQTASQVAATINDGTNAATAEWDSGTTFDNLWHKCDVVWDTTPNTLSLYVDAVLVATATNTSVGSVSGGSGFALGIGATAEGAAPYAGSLSLFRLSTRVPSSIQIRQAYESEIGMFAANAECLLQSGSTDAVIGVDIDPLTEKVLVTQTDAVTVFKKGGLVVDSKPTVNSGNSEKGRLWGDLRSEQNSANAYVTAPANDQRQINEMVRGLANDLPKGVDLSKAKALLLMDNSAGIDSSYNIKSITDVDAGIQQINLGMPMKSDQYFIVGSNATSYDRFFSAWDTYRYRDSFRVYMYRVSTSALNSSAVAVAVFGEAENE